MKRMVLTILFTFALCLVATAQQDKSKRPSPPAQAQCKFSDGTTITMDYSSPRMKGRKIFGDLVPYGEVWRTGANDATTFETTANLTPARVPMSVSKTSGPVENFTINLNQTDGSCTLQMSWENTQASIKLSEKK